MKSNSPTTKHRFLRSKETSRFKYCRVCGEIRSNSIHGVEETTTKQSDHFPDIKEKVEKSEFIGFDGVVMADKITQSECKGCYPSKGGYIFNIIKYCPIHDPRHSIESPLKEWEEFDDKFISADETFEIRISPFIGSKIKAFIKDNFVQKSKVREAIGEDEEVPDKAIVQGSEYKGMYPGIQAESRNELRAEILKELEL